MAAGQLAANPSARARGLRLRPTPGCGQREPLERLAECAAGLTAVTRLRRRSGLSNLAAPSLPAGPRPPALATVSPASALAGPGRPTQGATGAGGSQGGETLAAEQKVAQHHDRRPAGRGARGSVSLLQPISAPFASPSHLPTNLLASKPQPTARPASRPIKARFTSPPNQRSRLNSCPPPAGWEQRGDDR